MQANKNFILQWDLSWGNHSGSYNGGRLMEYIMALWVGVVLPLYAFYFGRYLEGKLKLHITSDVFTADTIGSSTIGEWFIFVVFVIITFLLIVIPICFYPTWSYLTYTALFGVAGAYLRYILAWKLNPVCSTFPVGTFIANVSGTWLLAILTLISNLVIGYYEVDKQAILFGCSTGLCGCLTTVSTFVAEIDTLAATVKIKPTTPYQQLPQSQLQQTVSANHRSKLSPAENAFRYVITTIVVTQFGLIFLYDIPSYLSVPQSSVEQPIINQCKITSLLCSEILERIACPFEYRINSICDNDEDYSTFKGECFCGRFEINRTIKLMIDSQTRYNASNSLVNIWPQNAHSFDDPTQTFDFCLSHQVSCLLLFVIYVTITRCTNTPFAFLQNLCDHFMNRIGCPKDQRQISACQNKGIAYADHPVCTCGGNDFAGDRIKEVLVDTVLFRRYDLQPYLGYPTTNAIDFGFAYQHVCDRLLEHVNCPVDQRYSVGNIEPGNYSTFIGKCSCGEDAESGFDVHQRIAVVIYDSLMRMNFQALLVPFNDTRHLPPNEKTWDLCASYHHICVDFLNRIGCPAALRDIHTCDSATSNYPYGQVYRYNGSCACGAMSLLGDRNFQIVVDGLTLATINTHYLYIPPPSPSYTVMVAHNPYRQLLYQTNVNEQVVVPSQ
jgi:fluoride ion exporter CrcB/FEX